MSRLDPSGGVSYNPAYAVRDTLTGALYPQPNRMIAERVAEWHGHCEVVEHVDAAITDEQAIAAAEEGLP